MIQQSNQDERPKFYYHPQLILQREALKTSFASFQSKCYDPENDLEDDSLGTFANEIASHCYLIKQIDPNGIHFD